MSTLFCTNQLVNNLLYFFFQVKDIIDLGPEKFRVIQQEGDVQVIPDPDKSGRDEYFNKLVIAEATESDAGTYYCFVKSAIGYKFKSAYLTVVPSKFL